jgi:hypothetical protein
MTRFIDAKQVPDLIQEVSSDNILGARADFKPQLFDTLIEQKGYRMKWEQGMFCSCLREDSGQPSYGCPACKGEGYIYFEPTDIRAVVTSINGNKQQDRPGLDDMGSAYLTPSSRHNVGFRDRFTFMDFTAKFSEIIKRSDNGVPDRLRYPAKEIISVRKLDKIFSRGTHFDVSEDGTELLWKPSYEISTGDRYSVLYNINPVYIAIGPIHEIRGTYTMAKAGGLEAFVQLPKQFMIKREDFLTNG